MIDRLEHARVFADSDYDGEKQARHFALLAIANASIAIAERMDEIAKAAKRNKGTQTKVGKREMNALETKTIKSGKHKNLRMVNGTRWLIWSKKKNAWVVYDRKRKQQKHRLIITGDETEAIKWLLYGENK